MSWLLSDLALWLLLAAFGVYEVIAHFVAHNKGPHTLSFDIWTLEHTYGLPARIAVGVVMAGLFTHLEFHFPL